MWKNGGLFNMALIIFLLSHRGIEWNEHEKKTVTIKVRCDNKRTWVTMVYENRKCLLQYLFGSLKSISSQSAAIFNFTPDGQSLHKGWNTRPFYGKYTTILCNFHLFILSLYWMNYPVTYSSSCTYYYLCSDTIQVQFMSQIVRLISVFY